MHNTNSGLIVKGATEADNQKIENLVNGANSTFEFTGDYFEDGNYFFFPESPAHFDTLEIALDKVFNQNGISAQFEGQ